MAPYVLAALLAVACDRDPVASEGQVARAAQPTPARSLTPGPSPALTSTLDPSLTFSYEEIGVGRPFAINNAGLIVGDLGANNNAAATWTEAGGTQVLGQLDGNVACCSGLTGVNDLGQAVGNSNYLGSIPLTLWTQSDNSYVLLPTGHGRNFFPHINDAGDVAFTDDASGGQPQYRTAAGSVAPLPRPAPFISGWAHALNNAGVVVGYLNVSTAPQHAVAWPSYTQPPVILGSLGGDHSLANHINDAGDIVGWSEVTPGSAVRHAVLWPASGGIVDLNTWPNPCSGESEANGINGNGIIVGRCGTRPVLWTAVEGMRELPLPPGLTTGDPHVINDGLQIGGWSPIISGGRGAFWKLVNRAPVANAGGPHQADEGSKVVFDGSGSDDADGDALTYAWDFGDGKGGTGPAPDHTYADNGVYTVSLVVTDSHGVSSEPATTTATIANVAPVLGALSLPASPLALASGGTLVSISASFTDAGFADTHTGTLACDGGLAGAVSAAALGGSGAAGGTCTFTTAGVYLVSLTVTDDDGGSDTSTAEQFVVVYDPGSGFVTGGGWIISPAGALTADPSRTGKANFGFVSKYQKGANVPTGNTEFHFQSGSFAFSSTSYDWLVVAGARAQYKGEGTVNGSAGFAFLLTATDGDVSGGGGTDRLRLKVWSLASGAIVYDNMMGAGDDPDSADPQAIGGGSVTIHK